MKTKYTAKLAVAVLVVITMVGCMWDPPQESSVGSVTLDFSAFAGSAFSGSSLPASAVNAARVWLFNGRVSYVLDPANNQPFVQVSLADAGNANVTLDGIPEDAGYRIQVVLGQTGGNGWFKPILFDNSTAFQVSGGRETPVTIVPRSPTALTGISDIQYAREGRNVVGAVGGLTVGGTPAVAVSDSASAGVSAVGTAAVYLDSSTLTTELPTAITLESGTTVNSVTVGPWGTKDTSQLYLGTNRGIVAPGRSVGTQPAAAVRGVTSVGSFVVTEPSGTTTVVFYQRPGGLGGAGFTTASPVASDWDDIPLDDLVGQQDPVYSQASDVDSSRAVFATQFGSFIFTSALFASNQSIDFVSVLTGQGSAEGLKFFGINLPGSGTRLQVQQVAFVNSGDGVVIGTPRGAFYAPFSSINDGTQTGVVTLADVFDQPVQQIVANTSGNRVAILTNRVLAIYSVATGGQLSLSVVIPSVAVAMGTPRTVSFASANQVLMSGTEGLVRITLP